jgi:hypothetical protein
MPGRHGLSLQERFFDKVYKCEILPPLQPELGPCWVWTAFCNRDGYGMMRFPDGHKLAHRVAWEMEHGAIPEGLKVLHRCDNPPCVRLSHLFVGTTADNVLDCVTKGRTRKGRRQDPLTVPRGVAHPAAQLTDDDVRTIRARVATGETQRAVAADYPVSYKMVNRIIKGKAWTHVG